MKIFESALQRRWVLRNSRASRNTAFCNSANSASSGSKATNRRMGHIGVRRSSTDAERNTGRFGAKSHTGNGQAHQMLAGQLQFGIQLHAQRRPIQRRRTDVERRLAQRRVGAAEQFGDLAFDFAGAASRLISSKMKICRFCSSRS